MIVGLWTPPTVNVTAAPNVLWPANHKYVKVNALLDASDDATAINRLSVTSNEPKMARRGYSRSQIRRRISSSCSALLSIRLLSTLSEAI